MPYSNRVSCPEFPALLLLLAIFLVTVPASCDTIEPPRPIPVVPADQMPAWSPDGRFIAYLHDAGWSEDTTDVTGLYVLDLESGERRLVIAGWASSPDWHPDGEQIAFSSGDIFTIRADGSDLQQVTSSGNSHFPSWSPDGEWLAFDTSYRDAQGAHVIWLVSPDGSNLRDISQHGAGEWRSPDWSPNGRDIVHLRFLDGVFGEEVFVMDSTGANAVRLTYDEHNDRDPAWSPDGEWIAWSPITNDDYALWIMRADGSEKSKLVDQAREPAWSPDSELLVFARPAPESRFTALWIIRRDGTGLQQLTHPPH